MDYEVSPHIKVNTTTTQSPPTPEMLWFRNLYLYRPTHYATRFSHWQSDITCSKSLFFHKARVHQRLSTTHLPPFWFHHSSCMSWAQKMACKKGMVQVRHVKILGNGKNVIGGYLVVQHFCNGSHRLRVLLPPQVGFHYHRYTKSLWPMIVFCVRFRWFSEKPYLDQKTVCLSFLFLKHCWAETCCITSNI